MGKMCRLFLTTLFKFCHVGRGWRFYGRRSERRAAQNESFLRVTKPVPQKPESEIGGVRNWTPTVINILSPESNAADDKPTPDRAAIPLLPGRRVELGSKLKNSTQNEFIQARNVCRSSQIPVLRAIRLDH